MFWRRRRSRSRRLAVARCLAHHPTISPKVSWLAGGGVPGGIQYGTTDDYGYFAEKDKVHIHDLHATILHLLEFDHEQLTYHYAGRNF